MAEGYVAPELDTPNCCSCGECVNVNAEIFAFDEEGRAVIKNAQGGPYSDLVKAAEQCPAMVIKPGLPADRSDPETAKLIARAEQFNQ
ncbi:MAG: hypothetical protein GX589_05455 [Deltaproteobacteria bacterium]|nr:hypothetical protein [Deltaproteobacteria bacterium]